MFKVQGNSKVQGNGKVQGNSNFRVTKKTHSKINKKIYHFSYIIELIAPADPLGRISLLNKTFFFSMSEKLMKLLMLSIPFLLLLDITLNQIPFH